MTDTIEIRRFEPHPSDELVLAPGELIGCYVDAEATGKDPLVDRLTELAIVRFAFTPDGKISQYEKAHVYLEDPGIPIPAEIVELTGITDDMVRGKRLPEGEINELVAGAAIVISHNAQYDRQLLEERGLHVFKHLRWGCSYLDIPEWRKEYGCSKMVCLTFRHLEMFYDAHRADVDCYAGVSLLSTTLPRHDGKRAMSYVLDAMKISHVRILVDKKFVNDGVKPDYEARGYRWLKEGKQWLGMMKEVTVGDAFSSECAWLDSKGISTISTAQFDSRKRFSNRITYTARPLRMSA